MENIEKINEKLEKLRNDAKINNVPILRPKTAELLCSKIKEENPKNILEIGTAIGYSGILILSSTQEATLHTLEKDENSYLIAKQNFSEVALTNRVVQYCGDAIDILPKIETKFDFIFLDGPKGQYVKYLPYLLNLLNVGGTLFSDNVLYRGMVNGKTEVKKSKKTLVKNLRLFLQELDSNENLQNTILELEDGVSITKKLR